MRADKALLELKLAKSRTHASDLIDEGVVFYKNQKVKKASQDVELHDLIVQKEIIYVSRGAYKLKSAIEIFHIDPKEKIVADVGASTGGFTDLCLRSGCTKVYAIDVGHNQLAESLVNDSRVINLEGVNIKNGLELPEKVDLVVSDLSFISLKLVLKPMMNLLKENAQAIVLIKPQFEVGPGGLSKNGIVKDQVLVGETILGLFDWAQTQNIPVNDLSKSEIAGKDGNQEYFFLLGDKTKMLNRNELEKKLKMVME